MTGYRRMLRYVVPVDDQQHIIPLTHAPVAVAGKPHDSDGWAVEFWAEHTNDTPPVNRTFQVFGTGQPLPENAQWIGTCGRVSGLVWHLYELGAAVVSEAP